MYVGHLPERADAQPPVGPENPEIRPDSHAPSYRPCLLCMYNYYRPMAVDVNPLCALVFDRSIVPFAGRRAAGQSKQGSEMD
jgi:hypothetical protein